MSKIQYYPNMTRKLTAAALLFLLSWLSAVSSSGAPLPQAAKDKLERASIYTLVYNSWLGYPPDQDFDDEQGGAYSANDQAIIRRLMRNHADALAAAGQAEEAEAWRAEADHLERRVGSGVPWVDHEMPVALTSTFELYRTDLVDLYCPATSTLEFGSVRKKGLSFRTD